MATVEEQMLEEYCKTRSIDLRNQILEQHLYIASIVARRFSGRGVEYDDLYQVASLALLKAIERYDCSKGVKLSSFAAPTVVGEVKNFFRDRSRLIRMPRRSGDLIRKIETKREELEQGLMRSPTVYELADALYVTPEDVLEAVETRSAINATSLDSQLEEDTTGTLQSILGDEDRGFGDIEDRDLVERIITNLPEMEREVVQQRFFDNRSQREIAQELGVSQMTISRAERRALERFREMLGVAVPKT